MAGDRSILLRITGDPEEAQAALDEVIAKVQELNKQKGGVEVEMLGVERAKADLDDIIAKIKLMPKSEHIRIQIDADQAKIDKLIAQMALLKAAMAGNPEGRGTTQQSMNMGNLSRSLETTTAHMRSLKTEAGSLDQTIAKLGVESSRALTPFEKAAAAMKNDIGGLDQAFNQATQDLMKEGSRALTPFEKATRATESETTRLARSVTGLSSGLGNFRTKLTSLVSDVLGKVPLIGGLFSKIAEGFGSLITGLIPEAATGVGGLVVNFVGLGATLPILAALLGLMASLVASLAMAVAGVVALGLAFLVALGPIVLLLGVVAIKIKDIIGAQQNLKTAAQNLKAAYTSQAQAVLQLHQAEQQQSLQRIAALADEKTSILALTDAENAQRDALLGVQSAKLGAQQSRLDLAKFNEQFAAFGLKPGDLTKKTSNVDVTTGGQKQVGADKLGYEQLLIQYKQAVLAIKVADQGVNDATAAAADSANTLAQAHATVARYLTMGLKAYPAYLQATNATAVAVGNLARANEQVTSNLLAQRQALLHGRSDASALMTAWTDLKKALNGLLGPAEKAVFAGIDTAMTTLAAHGKGKDGLTAAFTAIGKAIGGAFVWWAKMMDKPGNVKIIHDLLSKIPGFVKETSRWLGSVIKFILQIAQTAMPFLVGVFSQWADKLDTINGKHGKIKDVVTKIIGQTKLWYDKIGNVLTGVGRIIGFMQTLLPIAEAVAAPFVAMAKAVSAISAISKANAAATRQANVNVKSTNALIAKDEALLSGKSSSPYGVGNITEAERKRLLIQIKDLKSQMSSIAANKPGGSENTQSSGWYNLIKAFVGGHAAGGVTTGAQLGIIGESGREGIIPLAGGGAQIVADALAAGIVRRFAALLPRTPSATAGGSSPASVSHVTHAHVHLNQGNTIQDDQHFFSVLERALAAEGIGWK
jgi:hypothetical protein